MVKTHKRKRKIQ